MKLILYKNNPNQPNIFFQNLNEFDYQQIKMEVQIPPLAPRGPTLLQDNDQ